MESIHDDAWKLLASFHTKDGPQKNTTDSSKTDDEMRCFLCESTDIYLDEGNYVCRKCSCIVARFIDQTAEWRFYGHEDNKSSDPTRCGAPVNDLLPQSSLGSIISCQMFESYSMKLIRKYHMWNSITYKERSLYNIFDTITVNAINNGISSTIIEEAKNLYKTMSESKISRGDNISGLIASSICMSCKRNKVPRTAKEIAKIFNLKNTTMTRGCKKFHDIVTLEVSSTTAEDFIERFCSKLNLSVEVRELCKTIIQGTMEHNIVSSNTPPSLAAATIYMSVQVTKCESGVTKEEISKVCEISIVTLLKCYKKMYEHRSILLPTEIIFKYSVT